MWSNLSLQDYAIGGGLVAASLCARRAVFRLFDVATPKQRPEYMYRYFLWQPLGLLTVFVAIAGYLYIAELLKNWLLADVYAVAVGVPVFVVLSCDSLGEVLDVWDAVHARVRQRL